MASFSFSSWNLSVVVFLAVVSIGTLNVVEGIKCYQCGTYIITSVTPCRNLSVDHYQECPSDAHFCSKYSNPAIQVYGCEKTCEERVQNSFEIHCCSTDRCNTGYSARAPMWLLLMAPLVAFLLPSPLLRMLTFENVNI